jgi:hypothetical protein
MPHPYRPGCINKDSIHARGITDCRACGAHAMPLLPPWRSRRAHVCMACSSLAATILVDRSPLQTPTPVFSWGWNLGAGSLR